MKPPYKAALIAILTPVCCVIIAGAYFLIVGYFFSVDAKPRLIGIFVFAGLTIFLAFVGCAIMIRGLWKIGFRQVNAPMIGTNLIAILFNLVLATVVFFGIITSRLYNGREEFWNWCDKMNNYSAHLLADRCPFFGRYDCHAKNVGRNAKLAMEFSAVLDESGTRYKSNLIDLLIFDRNLTDDPDVTFSFGIVTSSGYTFTTSHKRGKTIFTWTD